MEASKREVLTTQEAADRLGVSTTSIQKMVNRGDLEAWVTPGGHRRIYLDSVERLSQVSRRGAGTDRSEPPCLRILLAEDDEEQVALFRQLMAVYGPVFELTVASDASQALIQVERQRPDVVVSDLIMQPFDGFHLVRTIANEEEYAGIELLVMSGLSPDEIAERGGLPPGVPVYGKPVSMERLMGFMDALLSRLHRRTRHGGYLAR